MYRYNVNQQNVNAIQQKKTMYQLTQNSTVLTHQISRGKVEWF